MKLSVLKGGARAKRHRAAKDFCEGPHGPRVFFVAGSNDKKTWEYWPPIGKKEQYIYST